MNHCKCGCGSLVNFIYKHGHNRKGKTISPEHRKKLIGHICTVETRQKIGLANSGIKNGMFGKKTNDSARKIISEKSNNWWNTPGNKEYYKMTHDLIGKCRKGALCAQKKIRGYKNTKPELEMEYILKDLHLTYDKNRSIWNIEHCYACDFYLPIYNIIIEVDGLYWHDYPNYREIDLKRNIELKEAGYKILRFWENKFNKEVVINALKEYGVVI